MSSIGPHGRRDGHHMMAEVVEDVNIFPVIEHIRWVSLCTLNKSYRGKKKHPLSRLCLSQVKLSLSLYTMHYLGQISDSVTNCWWKNACVSNVSEVMEWVGDGTCPPGILPSCHDRWVSSSASPSVTAIFSPVGWWLCWMDSHCCTSRKAAHLKSSRQSWSARSCPDHSPALLDGHHLRKKNKTKPNKKICIVWNF